MKKDIHPKNYRFVVFQDASCDYSFLTKSTVEAKETIKWEDGKDWASRRQKQSDLSLGEAQRSDQFSGGPTEGTNRMILFLFLFV